MYLPKSFEETRVDVLHDLIRAHPLGTLVTPWKMSDAPSRYIDRQLAAIVGLELTITRLVGKWKISQNRSKHDRASVIRELTKQGGESSVAMARLIDDATEDAI